MNILQAAVVCGNGQEEVVLQLFLYSVIPGKLVFPGIFTARGVNLY